MILDDGTREGFRPRARTLLRSSGVVLGLASAVPAIAEAPFTVEYVKSWPSGPNQYDLAVASNGDVYVVDINDGDVRSFSPEGVPLARWAPPGTPVGVAIDRHGVVHVAGGGVIRRYSADGIFLSSVPVAAPTRGVAVDTSGNLYTASGGPGDTDTTACVRKYDVTGRYLLRFPAPDPVMFHVADDGSVFVTNGGQHHGAGNVAPLIQKFSPAGELVAETTGNGDCDRFHILWGITGDGRGNVAAMNIRWPAPEGTPNLNLFSDSLRCIQAWRLQPPPGDPDPGTFLDIAFDGAGHFYLADTFHQRIVKYRYARVVPPAPPLFTLAPVRPNPSAGAVRFEFTTRVDGPAQLDVHDVAGRRLRRWEWTMLAAGPHRVDWDGRDDTGRSVGPGVVHYRLTSNGARLVDRLVQLR